MQENISGSKVAMENIEVMQGAQPARDVQHQHDDLRRLEEEGLFAASLEQALKRSIVAILKQEARVEVATFGVILHDSDEPD